MIEINRYIICYPGGSGGSFLAAALNHALNNTVFSIDSLTGHCHNNPNRLTNCWFEHGESVQSMRQELDAIDRITFTSTVFEGHFRNIVAIKEKMLDQLGYNVFQNTKIIKISVNCDNPNEILFVAMMMQRKAKSFLDLPFDQYLEQTTNYINSWYWVENTYTMPNTINLSLADVFFK